MNGDVASIRYHVTYADFVEAEDGMARHQGFDPPRRAGPGAFAWRVVIEILARVTTATATVSDEGLLIHGARGIHPWTEIGDTFETDGLVVLVLETTSAPIGLPKRVMTVAQLDTIREFASRVVHQHDRIIAIRTGQA